MFDTILIANRGEIACRVARSARAMGCRVVAVYSDADVGAAHVAAADVAVHIGGSAPADSYLRGDRIIAAARETGAQAIHPGYGFLSENPDFVEAVTAAGLVFIGPSADAIRAMGLKDAAKALMAEAGVPGVPGYHGADQDPDHLAAAAEAIGYPVLIKAVAGGGGKGMRLVSRARDFPEALDSARAEAQGAFGNPAVLVEKYIEKPRHIEVQVFGDGSRAVHLFERDCSLQRRHQKVIEEAPAPGMTPELRAAMGEAAVRAAEAIGYSGAGTVEFIVDASRGLRPDGFWFMEMNTRLQVEHPVTEAITGIDLVEWQLRVAAGEPLPLGQQDIAITGHAFEARLYAEDVPGGFLPATGRLAHLAFPGDARADSGVRPGDEISPWYDPMIAKLVTHGPTRAVALSRMRAALAGTEVAGTVTNLGFLAALCAHRGFVAGDVDTGLIARDLATLAVAPDVGPRDWALAGLAALGLLGPTPPAAGFHLWQPMAQSVDLGFGDVLRRVRVALAGPDRAEITLTALPDGAGAAEATHTADAAASPAVPLTALRVGGCWQIDGRAAPRVVRHGGFVTILRDAGRSFAVIDPLDRAAAAGAEAGNVITAPMPGLVRALFATPGQQVAAGDRLAVLEAMKMEHALLAARDGTVAEVLTEAGAQVEAGAALIRLEEPPLD